MSISSIDLVKNADFTIFQMDRALSYINEERVKIGTQLNRLESVINNNQISSESMTTSRSRIQDADYSIETTQLTKSQIIQQAATAILALANATHQLMLALLR